MNNEYLVMQQSSSARRVGYLCAAGSAKLCGLCAASITSNSQPRQYSDVMASAGAKYLPTHSRGEQYIFVIG